MSYRRKRSEYDNTINIRDLLKDEVWNEYGTIAKGWYYDKKDETDYEKELSEVRYFFNKKKSYFVVYSADEEKTFPHTLNGLKKAVKFYNSLKYQES